MLRGAVPDGAIGWAAFLDRADGVDPDVVADRAAAIGPEDISDILFTSGTTGAPKGAMLRHGAGIRAFTAWSDVIGLGEGDRYLIINPFFHSFGLKAGILACLLKGATMVPHAVFDVPVGHGPHPRGAHQRPAGAAGDLPDDAEPPRPRPVGHLHPAPGGHRGRPGAGATGRGHEERAWASTWWSPATA